MRTRQEIKAIGKARFKANYWTCVLAVLLVGAVLGVISSLSVGQSYTSVVDSAMYGTEPEAATIGIRTGVGGLLTLLLAGPLAVGLNYFHVMNVLGRTEDLTVITPFRSAFTNYPRKLGGYLWMELFIFQYIFHIFDKRVCSIRRDLSFWYHQSVFHCFGRIRDQLCDNQGVRRVSGLRKDADADALFYQSNRILIVG